MILEEAAEAAKAATPHGGPWDAVPTLLWVLFASILLLIFRKDAGSLLQNLVWRVRTGAALKLASFELGQSYVSPTSDVKNYQGAIQTRPDENEERWNQRRLYYEPNRHLLLVHRIAPSQEPGQLYDVVIYLVPHPSTPGATLASVTSVDYYFGHYWNSQIFTSLDRARSFSISTSAFGPFMCTAEILFTDNQKVMVNRYIDFEMGSLGSTSDLARASEPQKSDKPKQPSPEG